MSILDEIRAAKIKAAEDVVVNNLKAKLNPKPEIKPIDEHVWSDFYISARIANNGDVEIRTANDEFYLNDADLAVILKAKGYSMVKD